MSGAPPVSEHADVLIVGAGLSGMGLAHHLQEAFPGKTYVILEARETIGGTWDLFRYPGRPVRLRHVHARLPVPAVDRRQGDRRRRRRSCATCATPRPSTASTGTIRFGHRVVSGRVVERDGPVDGHVQRRDSAGTVTLHLRVPVVVQRLLPLRPGLPPELPGRGATSAGQVVHPQHWPADLDYAGKRVVVIGSGATAVTLVPAMAGDRGARDHAAALAHLHRVAAVRDAVARLLRRLLGQRRRTPSPAGRTSCTAR